MHCNTEKCVSGQRPQGNNGTLVTSSQEMHGEATANSRQEKNQGLECRGQGTTCLVNVSVTAGDAYCGWNTHSLGIDGHSRGPLTRLEIRQFLGSGCGSRGLWKCQSCALGIHMLRSGASQLNLALQLSRNQQHLNRPLLLMFRIKLYSF